MADNRRRSSRRRFIKTGSAGIVTVGLAGCAGGGDGGDGGGGGDGGDGGGGGGSVDIEGTTIEIWDTLWNQSEPSEAASHRFEEEFEEETGVELEWNRAAADSVFGGQWRQQIARGNMPDVLAGVFGPFTGQFIAQDVLAPFSDWEHYLDDEILNGIEWQMDDLEEMHSGYDAIYGVSGLSLAQDPFVGRIDLFEEAGLDPSNDFPPSDYEHLVEVAKTLQENLDAVDAGFPIYAVGGDAFDEITATWAIAYDEVEGKIVNEDWDDVNYDNDTWRRVIQEYVDIELEHEVSWGRPTTGDEDTVEPLMAGSVAFTQQNYLNYPTFRDREPDLLEDGNLQYAPAWEGPSGLRGIHLPYLFNIVDREGAQGMDSAKAERKLKASAAFVNKWLSDEWQVEIPENYGQIPANQNVWEQASTNQKEAGFQDAGLASEMTIMEQSSAWAIHPAMPDIQYNIPAPYLQDAMSGNLTVDEAIEGMTDEIRSTVFR